MKRERYIGAILALHSEGPWIDPGTEHVVSIGHIKLVLGWYFEYGRGILLLLSFPLLLYVVKISVK